MFSKEAIALAKPCVEAIKKIAERQEKKCVQCKGDGVVYLTSLSGESECFVCKGTGKVKGKWEWKPEVGEWCIWQDKLYVIYEVEENSGYVIDMKDIRIAAPYDFHYVMRKNLTPLLHWERIREILKQFGYSFSITSGASGGEITVYRDVGTDKLYEKYHNNDLRSTVMQAVIKLGKEE